MSPSAFTMHEDLNINASDISGGMKLVVLNSAAIAQPSNSSGLMSFSIMLQNEHRTNNPQAAFHFGQFPNPYFSRDKKKRAAPSEGNYQNRNKVIATVEKMRALKSRAPISFERLVGNALESNGIIEVYDDRTYDYMDVVSAFLKTFINCAPLPASILTDQILLSIPSFSSMGQELDFVKTAFQGPAKLMDAALFLRACVHRMLSKVVAVKESFAVHFDLLLSRKVAVSADGKHFSAPFVWVSTNLKRCGLTREIQIHGLVRAVADEKGKLASVKIFFDPFRLTQTFGSATFIPI